MQFDWLSNQNQFENCYKIVEIPRPKPVKSFGKYPNTIQAHPTDVLKEISRTKSQEKTLDDLRNELRNIFNSKFKIFLFVLGIHGPPGCSFFNVIG